MSSSWTGCSAPDYLSSGAQSCSMSTSSATLSRKVGRLHDELPPCVSVPPPADIPAQRLDCFTGVSAMHFFRKFLFNTAGECACLYWLDAERLRHTTDSDCSLRLVLWIQDTYLSSGGGSFFLGEELMLRLMTSCSIHNELSATERTKMIFAAQDIVLQSLKGYWCSRYMLHLQEEAVDPSTVKQIEADNILLTKHHSDTNHLPRIITDEGLFRADKRTERAAELKLACRLPSIPRSGSVLAPDSVYHTRTNVTLLLTPSTQDMFSRCAEFGAPDIQKQDDFNVLPFLTASLRADTLAGSPMLRYWKTLLRKPDAINHLLFWISVENLLTKDEMRRWYNSHWPSGRKTCPHISCFEEHLTAASLEDLLTLFIQKTSQRCVKLPSSIRQELCELLPKGLGQSLLVHAQSLVEKVSAELHMKCYIYTAILFTTASDQTVEEIPPSRPRALHEELHSAAVPSQADIQLPQRPLTPSPELPAVSGAHCRGDIRLLFP